MNSFSGKITSIESSGNITLVTLEIDSIKVSSVVLASPITENYLSVGNTIRFLFKETEVILGKGNIDGISLQNKFKGNITSIQKGELLSNIEVSTSIGIVNSIITSNAVEQLKLAENDEMIAMIKTNEIMLQP